MRSWTSTSTPASTTRPTPASADELRSEYVVDDDQLELTAWARDAISLELPEQILHARDCAGLCPVCGKDLNVEPHTHDDALPDPRWSRSKSSATAAERTDAAERFGARSMTD